MMIRISLLKMFGKFTLMQRVVITGGPASGKTSIISALNKSGYNVFPEIARKVIKQQLSLNSNKVPWDDITGFSQLVLSLQENDFTSSKPGINFFDRGIPDIIGYLNHGKQETFDTLTTSATKHNYDFVFILPPWEEIYENDNERRESFEAASKLFTALKSAYISCNYSPIIVPKLDVNERVSFILKHING